MNSTHKLEKIDLWSALALIMCWLTFIITDAIIDGLPWATTILVVISSITYFGFYLINKRGIVLPVYLKLIILPIFAWSIFVCWGIFISTLQLAELVTSSSNAALVLLFLNGPFVAMLISLLISAPLAIVYENRASTVALVLCLPVILISLPGLFNTEIKNLSRLILITEMVSILALLPYSTLLARRYITYWGNNTSA